MIGKRQSIWFSLTIRVVEASTESVELRQTGPEWNPFFDCFVGFTAYES